MEKYFKSTLLFLFVLIYYLQNLRKLCCLLNKSNLLLTEAYNVEKHYPETGYCKINTCKKKNVTELLTSKNAFLKNLMGFINISLIKKKKKRAKD